MRIPTHSLIGEDPQSFLKCWDEDSHTSLKGGDEHSQSFLKSGGEDPHSFLCMDEESMGISLRDALVMVGFSGSAQIEKSGPVGPQAGNGRCH
jgi:hypothetical protein